MKKLKSPIKSKARISGKYKEKRGDSYHYGIDLAVPEGTEIVAPIDIGIVLVRDDLDKGFGLWALGSALMPLGWHDGTEVYVPKHRLEGNKSKRGVETVFFFFTHMSDIVVAKNEVIPRGGLIGYSGSTGDSTGPHLHYQINRVSARKKDNEMYSIDPTRYV